MTGPRRLCTLAALALGLAATMLPLSTPASAVVGDRPDPAGLARRQLTEDGSGRARIVADRSGRVRFVGTDSGAQIHNPALLQGASVDRAAREHLDRYGAVLGASAGTTYARRSTAHAVSGTDAVTYQQQVEGVPVVGGEVVVSLGVDRGLRSIHSTVSTAAAVTPATVAEADAETTARGLVARSTRSRNLRVDAAGRWLLDPEVVDVDLPAGARTVWRFEVGDGAAVRQLVLVDDHTGQVLLHTDLIQHADRVVCDHANVPSAETPCTFGFARSEGSAPTGVADVNDAYDFAGATSAFYQQVAGIDLTALLGVNVSGSKKLASTVRHCTTDLTDPCPYPNAFWNGSQMFYGEGYASADDVVGHEMTHGVIDQYSRLFYWGQSGAINESMADVIGEIIDHRDGLGTDDPNNWDLGEDLPGGALRNLADPAVDGQPDQMTSNLYTADDTDYGDSGGVHTDSGVGNKTAYLISQGGSFGGQTISGIDAGDPMLTKSAKLYVDVIERLSSGADYADLAAQLDQSCQDLRVSAGFTAANCTAVHQAGVATELTTTPTNAAQPADAPATCPADTEKRELFAGESNPWGTVQSRAGWTRPTAAPDVNARSGGDSWYAADPAGIATSSLVPSAGITLPAGQPSYLAFQGWYLFDYDQTGYYDGGTVEIATASSPTPSSTAALPWVNGPDKVLELGYGNSGSGKPAFSGDSRGWVGSRLDLTSYAGQQVIPRFTMRSDNSYGAVGWYVDDITVYTCDPMRPSAARAVTVTGFVGGMTVSWAPPAVNPGGVVTYTVIVQPCGTVVTVPATSTSVNVRITPATCGSRYEVTVWPRDAAGRGGAVPPYQLPPTVAWLGMSGMRLTRNGPYLTLKGSLATFERPLVGATVQIQRKTASGWITISTLRTHRYGRFATTLKHRKRATYRIAYAGGPGLVGKATKAYYG